MKLDTIALVETPEGTDLHAEVVGLVPRGLAYTLDFLIRAGVLFVLGIIMTFMGKTGSGIYLLVFFLLEWWYPVYFEVYRGGQTWGKRSFNIKVVNDDLTPITFGPSLTRNLLRSADFFPAMYVFGTISILSTSKFQRLGDLAAGTIVIHAEPEPRNVMSLSSESLNGVDAIAPLQQLGEDQQAAFINFALNRGMMSKDRQSEVAEILRPRLPLNAADAAQYVRGVGKWLLGAR